ncbi:hypothetical protein [Methyloversatilis sp.]|uniref:hypothetical protein n=1 Tax=Methyloversatilis sp. TaxID=2569862 RepID=UPI003D2BBB91
MTALPVQTHTRLRVGVPNPGEREAAVAPGEPRAVLRAGYARASWLGPARLRDTSGRDLMPSGACYRELPTTLDRQDIDAPRLLQEQSR